MWYNIQVVKIHILISTFTPSSSSFMLLRILGTDTVDSMWLYDAGTVQNGVFTLSVNEQQIDAESKTHLFVGF